MKFFDSNVLAYAFYENAHLEKCQHAISEGGMTDAFNLIEAFFIIENETSRERAQKSIKSLLKSNIHLIEVDVNVIFESLKKINTYKLSIFDAIHYTCALLSGCSSILSYDSDFDGLEIKREEP